MSVCVALELKSGDYSADRQLSESLAGLAEFDEVDRELAAHGVSRLTDFVYRDVDLLEEMLEYAPEEAQQQLHSQLEAARRQSAWNDPQAGLQCVDVLINLLKEGNTHPDAIRDLESFQRVLVEAVEAGDQFRLVIT